MGWLSFARVWLTLPVVAVAFGVGYAFGGVFAGLAAAGGYFAFSVVFGAWARRNRARIRARLQTDPAYREHYTERSDRITRFLGWWMAACGVLLAVTMVAFVIVELVKHV